MKLEDFWTVVDRDDGWPIAPSDEVGAKGPEFMVYTTEADAQAAAEYHKDFIDIDAVAIKLIDVDLGQRERVLEARRAKRKKAETKRLF